MKCCFFNVLGFPFHERLNNISIVKGTRIPPQKKTTKQPKALLSLLHLGTSQFSVDPLKSWGGFTFQCLGIISLRKREGIERVVSGSENVIHSNPSMFTHLACVTKNLYMNYLCPVCEESP